MDARYHYGVQGSQNASGFDALDLARQQLDYAGVAAAAPSVKSILFKAQTMGPLKPTRPNAKAAAGAGAGLLAGALLFAPWIPETSSMGSLQVHFEADLPRREAQQIYHELLDNEPEGCVLKAQFSRVGSAADGDAGYLRLTATYFDRSSREIESALRAGISRASDQLDPLFVNIRSYNRRSWQSPAGLLRERTQDQPAAVITCDPPGSPVAAAVAHNDCIAQALGEDLAAMSPPVKLEAVAYFDEQGRPLGESTSVRDSTDFDFTLRGWPLNIGIKASPYANLTEGEQSLIRERAQQRLAALALLRELAPHEQPLVIAGGNSQLVSIIVLDRDGATNQYLTERASAVLLQPEAGSRIDLERQLNDIAAAALRSALPGIDYKLDYERLAPGAAKSGPRYVVRALLLGRGSAGSGTVDGAGERARELFEKAEASEDSPQF